jgi:hypothetical protein
MNNLLHIILIIVTLNSMAAAKNNTWTIVKSNIDNAFWSGPSAGDIRLGDVKPGTKVIPLQKSEDYCHVKFPDGQTGWIHSALLKKSKLNDRTLVQYNTKKIDIYRIDKFKNLVSGKNKSDLSEELGTPGALIYKGKSKETWYYGNIVLVSAGKRYKPISIQIEKDKVTAVNLVGEGRGYWVESLPLAYTIRGMSFLNVKEPGDPLGFTKNWHWSLKILLRLLWLALALLFFSIAGVTAYKLSGFFQNMEILSN